MSLAHCADIFRKIMDHRFLSPRVAEVGRPADAGRILPEARAAQAVIGAASQRALRT
jgi:hypothetical protein